MAERKWQINTCMTTNIEIFQKQGYCIVKSSISSELRDFITQYALFDEMQDYAPEKDQGQVPAAHSKYADPAMESLLIILKDVVEKNTGLELDPTYSYYRVYREKDELKIHTDRPSCEISCTLCFNFDYGEANYEWPIYMDGNPVCLQPGDLVIYRGCDLEHYRDKLNTNNHDSWHVQGFFHYVNKNGPYAEYKFDKRDSIGENNKKSISVNNNSKDYIIYTKETS